MTGTYLVKQFIYLLIAGLGCSASGLVLADKQFSAYPLANNIVLKPSMLVSFKKHPQLSRYQTALLNGLKDGPNFALNYTVVEVGCGTACQLIVVVDSKGEITHTDQACVGADYRLDSRLLIINPTAENPAAFGCQTQYWTLPE